MENTISRACNSDAVKIFVIVVLVVFLIWMICPSSEPFSGGLKPDIQIVSNEPQIYKQPEVPMIQPPSYDADTLAIQSGSTFIQQKDFYTPWGTMVQMGDFATADGSSALSPDSITDYTMNFNQCSPSCCSDQWPVPFKLPVDKMLCDSKDKFVPSSYYCNNGWQDSGCLCMTQKQSDFLQTRGVNSDY